MFLCNFTIFMGVVTPADISCYTCTSSNSLPMKCTRPEYSGTHKQCTSEGPSPVNCFKSVNITSGEVNKGCATTKHSNEKNKETEGEVVIYYCDSKLCNGAGTGTMGIVQIVLLCVLIVLL